MNTEELAASLRVSLARSQVPEQNHYWLVGYLTVGQPCEDFLERVLQNDLKGACQVADNQNRLHLWWVVAWLYEHAPAVSWGSPANYQAWLKKHAEIRQPAQA